MRLVAAIDEALRAAGTPERAEKERAYLKSALVHYGVPVPVIRRVVKAALRAEPVDRAALLAAVEALWGRPAKPVHERRAAAVELLTMEQALLTRADLPLIERLLRESRTWALVDALAVHVAGPLVERHGAAILDRWAKDPDFWLRRSALLALLVPLRQGGGDFERFVRYADSMLDDQEFFIRKAIGWVLRETGKKRPDDVRAYVASRGARMSALSRREATRNLPA